MEKLTENVYVEVSYPGCNTSFVVTEEGVVVIDTPMVPGDARQWIAEAEKHGPIIYVINNEPHPDHIAGDYLFLFDSGKGLGRCIILKAGRTFEKVGENPLEPLTWNNPVFEGKRMYVRTHRGLFCIEKPE